MIEPMQILDHGSLTLIDAWGSDEGIVEAARMSTSGGFVSWDPYDGHPKGDAGLLRYLYENKHATPFEMAGLVIEVKAPILVFRQWHRHRTQSYNEMSARYVPVPDEHYMPTIARCVPPKTTNRQARGTTSREPTPEEIQEWRISVADAYEQAEIAYQKGIDIGIPKEVARVTMPVARYSRMRASANLRNWLGFLTLRLDPHAQYEIRVYAEAVGAIIAQKFPRTWELFIEGKAV